MNATGLQTEYVWNNLLKVGKNGRGKPCDEIIDAQIEAFNVLADELRLLRPHVVIFFTGPGYDPLLERSFPDLEYNRVNNKWDLSQLALLQSDSLPIFSFRTYHPNYLYRENDRRNGIRDAVCRRIVRGIADST